MSGGGALNSEVQEFIRTAFGIGFVQGYGLTETNAGLTIQPPDDLRGGIAGVPVPSVEVKLESTPEICDRSGKPYLSTDRVDVEGNPVFGRGEILARGPSISVGYYMMPEQTKEVYKVRDDGCQIIVCSGIEGTFSSHSRHCIYRSGGRMVPQW